MPPPRPSHVVPLPLAELAALVAAPAQPGHADILVTGVSLDSRTVLPGDLYAALPGFQRHGADFTADAVTAGAVAVLTDPTGARTAERATDVPVLVTPSPRAVLGSVAAAVYARPPDAFTLFGITGTNGKTTTAYLLESALRGLGTRTGLIGTVETRIGTTRLPSVRTTPEAPELHALLAMMAEAGTEAVVMEVSSHALSQHRVDGAVFDVALFTNLSQDHLDFHMTMDEYFAAKLQLFTPEHSRQAVVCVDDSWGQRLAQTSAVPVTTVASLRRRAADWTVETSSWPEFTVTGEQGTLQLRCHLPGEFNVLNTAMAAVALVVAGTPLAEVRRALAEEPVVPGRMERVSRAERPEAEPDAVLGTEQDDDPLCIVDYAHTPDAVDAALKALRPITSGRLIVVIGAGGDRDRGKRRAMGAAAARNADVVIVTDDNPRSEDPSSIRAAVLEGARQVVGTGGVGAIVKSVVEGRAAAIREAIRIARASVSPPGDTVLVLGKGHETGQEVAGTVHPFDDRQAVQAGLAGAPYRPEATE